MAIREIIEIGKRVMQNSEAQAREFDFKSYEHDCLMAQAYEIRTIVLKIESILHVPGAESKLDFREDTRHYFELLRNTTDDEESFRVLKLIDNAFAKTILWAKKLSWLGDWDLNFDGRRTLLTIEFVPAADVKEFDVPRFYFNTGAKIEAINYKLEIKSSEGDLSEPLWISFSENWDEIEFSLHENKDLLVFRARAFTWDRSKFSGIVRERPFYAERKSEYFGNRHIVYYSANY